MGWGDLVLGWAAALGGVGRGVTGSLSGVWGFHRAHLWCSLWKLAVGEGGLFGNERSFALSSQDSKDRLSLGDGRTRRCSVTAQRHLGDRSATGAGRTATFGDHRRQNLGLQMETGSRVLESWQRSAMREGCSEVLFGERLMAISRHAEATVTHVCRLMGLGSTGRKGSETTTKNDKWRRNEISA